MVWLVRGDGDDGEGAGEALGQVSKSCIVCAVSVVRPESETHLKRSPLIWGRHRMEAVTPTFRALSAVAAFSGEAAGGTDVVISLDTSTLGEPPPPRADEVCVSPSQLSGLGSRKQSKKTE